MSYTNTILDEVKQNTPEKGFNVCILDKFERPGEMLTCIGHFDTKKEAEKVKEQHKNETVYIYGKD